MSIIDEIIENPKKVMAMSTKTVIRAIHSYKGDRANLRDLSRLSGISRQVRSAAKVEWDRRCYETQSLTAEELDAWVPGGIEER